MHILYLLGWGFSMTVGVVVFTLAWYLHLRRTANYSMTWLVLSLFAFPFLLMAYEAAERRLE